MQRVSSGYTIIEVMIFLAVSLVISVAAMNLISGKQSETDFNQKMRDTRSKIQDWLNDVSTGFTGGDPSQQHCVLNAPGNPNRPTVQAGAPPLGYSPNCIFLGKAIQFTDQGYSTTQDEQLYTYSIFGCRLKGCPASPSPNDTLPANMSEASPEAQDGLHSKLDLTETFSLAPAHVKSVCSQPAGNCGPPTPNQNNQSHIIGFFNSLSSDQNPTSNGAEDLSIYQFTFKGNDTKDGSQVDQCLNMLGQCNINPNVNPPALTNYVVCLTDGKHYAQLTITSNSGIGASTSLDYVSC